MTLLEIMCSASWRRLCLKVGTKETGVDVRPAADRARESLTSPAWRTGRHATPKTARYVTVAFVDLTELGAIDAAKHVASTIVEVTTDDAA